MGVVMKRCSHSQPAGQQALVTGVRLRAEVRSIRQHKTSRATCRRRCDFVDDKQASVFCPPRSGLWPRGRDYQIAVFSMPPIQSPTGQTATTPVSHGSVTITQSSAGPSQPVLRLRAVNDTPIEERPRVTWTEQVVDNEHMSKKSSKSRLTDCGQIHR